MMGSLFFETFGEAVACEDMETDGRLRTIVVAVALMVAAGGKCWTGSESCVESWRVLCVFNVASAGNYRRLK